MIQVSEQVLLLVADGAAVLRYGLELSVLRRVEVVLRRRLVRGGQHRVNHGITVVRVRFFPVSCRRIVVSRRIIVVCIAGAVVADTRNGA